MGERQTAVQPRRVTGTIQAAGGEAGSPIPAAKAAVALCEVSIGQSMPSSNLSNQSRPRIFGYSAGTGPSMSSIQAALEPPCSLEPTSPIIIGFEGAIVLGDLVVGRAEELVEAPPAVAAWPGWCPSCSRRGRSSRRRRRRGRASEVLQLAVGVDVRAPDPGRVGRADRGEDVVDVAPGGDVFAGLVAVDALRPGEPVAVHLPVEAEEEGVAPVARLRRRSRGCRSRSGRRSRRRAGSRARSRLRRDRLRAPAEERDRAVAADVFPSASAGKS